MREPTGSGRNYAGHRPVDHRAYGQLVKGLYQINEYSMITCRSNTDLNHVHFAYDVTNDVIVYISISNMIGLWITFFF